LNNHKATQFIIRFLLLVIASWATIALGFYLTADAQSYFRVVLHVPGIIVWGMFGLTGWVWLIANIASFLVIRIYWLAILLSGIAGFIFGISMSIS